jgi:hypothetical protein
MLAGHALHGKRSLSNWQHGHSPQYSVSFVNYPMWPVMHRLSRPAELHIMISLTASFACPNPSGFDAIGNSQTPVVGSHDILERGYGVARARVGQWRMALLSIMDRSDRRHQL